MADQPEPMCPGDPVGSAPHPLAALSYRDEFAKTSADSMTTMPLRVVFCSKCGHVFSIAARPA